MTGPTRAEKLAGLHELADWLEAHPALPLPTISGSVFPAGQNDDDKDLAKALAELYQLAEVMGVEPFVPHVRHVRAEGPTFSGGLSYQVIVCDAAEDFARGVGRVADPGAGSATAPAETGAQPAACLEEVGGSDSGQGKAEPPTEPTKSSPAGPVAPADDPPADAVPGDSRPLDRPGPDVWVPIRRRGIGFHGFHGLGTPGEYTACGRAARPNGNRIPQAEAEAFGAVPCPRCYGEQVTA